MNRALSKYPMNDKPKFPNTFIIGVQKAGTTTLDDWLSQHPQIYCYESLKDVHLFARFKTLQEIEQRLAQEPVVYKNQPIVLQSAVNYIFYPQLLKSISEYVPEARLILILRNPVNRAISSFQYFKKMLRENRSMEEALFYKPKTDFEFSKDNSDFTYIEHGFYFKQIKDCFKYFSKDQLLFLDYDDLADNSSSLLKKLYSFLNVDDNFQPDLTPKNITGSVKNQSIQNGLIHRSKFKKWIVDNLINFWMPVTKRKKFKKKLFEMNTANKKNGPIFTNTEITQKTTVEIKKQLQTYFIEDTKQLDVLLNTNFYEKWFTNQHQHNKAI